MWINIFLSLIKKKKSLSRAKILFICEFSIIISDLSSWSFRYFIDSIFVVLNKKFLPDKNLSTATWRALRANWRIHKKKKKKKSNWRSIAPSKVQTLTNSRESIAKRVSICDGRVVDCVWCPEILEVEDHLFCIYKFFGLMWYLIFKWMGGVWFSRDYYLSFGHLCFLLVK